jgi:hypothetical protein
MYILCDKTASFYSKIKNIINIPIVVCSTALSILNTTDFISHTDMISITRNISIACNLLIAITVAILNLFKIPEKEYSFKTHSDNFFQLNNKITTEIAKSKTIYTKIDILRIIDEYNLYCEKISFHIPSRIRKRIIKDYNNYKLPLLLINNDRKNDKKHIKMAYFFNMFKKLPKSPSTTTSYTTTHEVYNISRSSSLSSINIIHDDYIPKSYHNGSPFSVFDMRNSPVRQLQMSPLAIVPAHTHKVYMTNKAFSKTHILQPFDKDLVKKLKRSRSS